MTLFRNVNHERADKELVKLQHQNWPVADAWNGVYVDDAEEKPRDSLANKERVNNSNFSAYSGIAKFT